MYYLNYNHSLLFFVLVSSKLSSLKMKYVTLEIVILTFNTFIQFSAWENGTISIFIGDENKWYSYDTGIVFDVNYLVISAYGGTQCCWQMFAGIQKYLIFIVMTQK